MNRAAEIEKFMWLLDQDGLRIKPTTTQRKAFRELLEEAYYLGLTNENLRVLGHDKGLPETNAVIELLVRVSALAQGAYAAGVVNAYRDALGFKF